MGEAQRIDCTRSSGTFETPASRTSRQLKDTASPPSAALSACDLLVDRSLTA